MLKLNNLLPGEIDGVTVGDDFDDLPINRNAISTNRLNISVEDAEGRIVLEEMRGLLDTARVIDGNDIKGRVLPAMPAPQEIPSNSSKSIDGYLQFRLHYSTLVLPSTNLRFIQLINSN